VPDLLKIVIFRILQEAMNNIAKYSNATRVDLYLKRLDDSIEMTIQDNEKDLPRMFFRSQGFQSCKHGRAG
jgi:signal transduction histidine kinase